MSQPPNKPKAPTTPSDTPASGGIQVETNDAVGAYAPAVVESVVEDRGGGLTIETFTGLQQDVDWAEASATPAVAIPADVFGDE